jgi:hypothetical protein
MLAELDHAEPSRAVGRESDHETASLKLDNEPLDVGVVERKDLRLDPARPVLDDAVPVGLTPQAGEQEPGQRLALTENVVEEKSWLDVTGSCHLRPLRFLLRRFLAVPPKRCLGTCSN